MSKVLIRLHPSHLVFRDKEEAERLVRMGQAVYTGQPPEAPRPQKVKTTSTKPQKKTKKGAK